MSNSDHQKIFITADEKVNIICPECRFVKQVPLSDAPSLKEKYKLSVKCVCGHRFAVLIERRGQFRKEVNFAGTYSVNKNGKLLYEGTLRIVNISKTGLRLATDGGYNFSPGETVSVSFNLDDSQNTRIEKEVIIQNIEDENVGVKFVSVNPSNPSDRAIGFYFL